MAEEEMLVVGKPLQRVDALEKVTGEGIYTGDLNFPNMLHAKVKRSERAHARIARIETSQADALPGDIRIFSSKDIPGENSVGVIVPDQP
ncbi:MAG: xanthine dehydrogenase family protein molybdopterin-binding subunit, partial [Dehalococcoidia bacterium]|nr:xanthine dehydrogenase family protein molybdopterin-binding subunit [Dehalococcoidia bacterium]